MAYLFQFAFELEEERGLVRLEVGSAIRILGRAEGRKQGR
jgi:hypothetical protein